MAAMPVLKPLHDAAGLVRMIASTYQAVSGSGLAGVENWPASRGPSSTGSSTWCTTAARWSSRPQPLTSRRSPSTSSHFAGSLVDDGSARPTRTRSCVTRAARSSDPGSRRERHLRAGAGLHRALAVDQRRVLRTDFPDRARQILAAAPGVTLVDVPTPLAAAGADDSLVGRIRQDPGVPTAAVWRCSSPGQPAQRRGAEHHSDCRTAGSLSRPGQRLSRLPVGAPRPLSSMPRTSSVPGSCRVAPPGYAPPVWRFSARPRRRDRGLFARLSQPFLFEVALRWAAAASCQLTRASASSNTSALAQPRSLAAAATPGAFDADLRRSASAVQATYFVPDPTDTGVQFDQGVGVGWAIAAGFVSSMSWVSRAVRLTPDVGIPDSYRATPALRAESPSPVVQSRPGSSVSWNSSVEHQERRVRSHQTKRSRRCGRRCGARRLLPAEAGSIQECTGERSEDRRADADRPERRRGEGGGRRNARRPGRRRHGQLPPGRACDGRSAHRPTPRSARTSRMAHNWPSTNTTPPTLAARCSCRLSTPRAIRRRRPGSPRRSSTRTPSSD